MAKITFKATLPDILNPKKLNAAGIRAVNATLDAIEKDFDSSVKDFNTKPEFRVIKARLEGSVIRGSVGTSEENYTRLNFGTPAHMVPKSGPRRMAYRAQYRRKTKPGRIASNPGGPSGGRIVRFGQWRIRGIDAMNYDTMIATKNQPVLEQNVNVALKSLGVK